MQNDQDRDQDDDDSDEEGHQHRGARAAAGALFDHRHDTILLVLKQSDVDVECPQSDAEQDQHDDGPDNGRDERGGAYRSPCSPVIRVYDAFLGHWVSSYWGAHSPIALGDTCPCSVLRPITGMNRATENRLRW